MSTNNNLYSIEKLDGTNFQAWKFKIKMVLIDKELWAYVDGDKKTAPTNAEQLAIWQSKDQRALSTICLSVKDTELVHLVACDTSAKAWKKLHDVHEDKGLARRLFLKRAFVSTRFKDGESMQEHINRIVGLTQQLASIGAPVPDEDIAITLLCSLPDSYDNLIVALESRAEALTAEFVTARLLQEETRRKGSATGTKQDEAAFLSKGKGKGNGKGPNHQGQRRERPRCYGCGSTWHKVAECPKKPAEAQARTADTAFIAKGQAKETSDHWYIDSGATHHLTSRREWFQDFKAIAPRNIHLADNRIIKAEGMGTIRVQLDVNGERRNGTFHEVLYVPNFCGNLLSVIE